ncbi:MULTISPECIES: 50S ribosomal protein L25/general stress protein Ctc [Rhodococcus]|jgi:large subunit ribosomal protein L25|uniref:Large ribosomal subunit protein bL25 n=1 Tax=Rhodococcus oxybenzonivorans TaxID=1990687 RepID=A0A2S2BZD9_9NOCA|nr:MULTISPECIES: 50S ribosomal protein L25/general stress protein Ctc [Rhodococcus]AWK73934.1 50S ribosomal protein L25/general stress protein Ctc [Rhodococcus oxybenzonivorans]MDV7243991.1 50S ribosomal protein L25/general stress protein Ctc [Rhodococcus oxybenzonivorans]MDV7263750.1 50S ribosomal protein L25/general stress protein Ctc [Rhodococcus oxybenzonivorans]MDV7274767.1 50S ribosomal protein L25/general stress protein Ctc [Rhodococcus oxybenzonivorans]MDV7335006.1 50S ribosomal protei
MSDENTLVAAVRTEFGKGAARRARRDGQVPAVLYGHGEDPRHLNLPSRDFAAILRAHGTNAILNLDIDGTPQVALTKSVVIHPIRNYIEHADLLVIKKGEKVTVEVPVVVTGEAASGTLVAQDAATIALEADALHIPEQIEVSVEGLEAGTQILANQLELPKGSTLQADPELLIVNVVPAPTAADLEEETGEAAGTPAEEGAES